MRERWGRVRLSVPSRAAGPTCDGESRWRLERNVRERDAHVGLTWHNRHHQPAAVIVLFFFFFLLVDAVVFTWTGHVDRAGHDDRHHLPYPLRPILTVNLTTRTRDLSQRITELFKSMKWMALHFLTGFLFFSYSSKLDNKWRNNYYGHHYKTISSLTTATTGFSLQ